MDVVIIKHRNPVGFCLLNGSLGILVFLPKILVKFQWVHFHQGSQYIWN